MRVGRAFLLAGALAAVPASVHAAAPRGAVACSGCHAQAARPDQIPSLSGRSADEIATAMLAFKAGTRAATVMDRIAKGFSDEEIRAIAQWLGGDAGASARAAKP